MSTTTSPPLAGKSALVIAPRRGSLDPDVCLRLSAWTEVFQISPPSRRCERVTQPHRQAGVLVPDPGRLIKARNQVAGLARCSQNVTKA